MEYDPCFSIEKSHGEPQQDGSHEPYVSSFQVELFEVWFHCVACVVSQPAKREFSFTDFNFATNVSKLMDEVFSASSVYWAIISNLDIELVVSGTSVRHNDASACQSGISAQVRPTNAREHLYDLHLDDADCSRGHLACWF